ncbi:MAG: protein translocase subunit SecF [Rhodospirillaceae bacterium]|nr:protein translocase subunit SecF [Rhodospirillaceae bacterium]
MLLRLVPAGTTIPFVRYRRIYLALSVALLILSGAMFFGQGLNFGIDFKGGILLQVTALDEKGNEKPADVAGLRSRLNALGLGEVSIQNFGTDSEVLIRVEKQPGDNKRQMQAIETVTAALGKGYRVGREEFVGPKVGAELIQAGIIATVLALLAIMAYVWFRFEWQFAIAAVAALTHDVLLTIGLFSLFQFEFNLSTVAAVLTIAGYSINDTVVVFDRVRENMRKYKKLAMPDLMNLSLNDTLSRTVLTSVTTLLALLALFFLGGEVIRGFSIALIWGVMIGAYSSICLAVPLLLILRIKRLGRSSDGSSDAGDAAEAAAG